MKGAADRALGNSPAPARARIQASGRQRQTEAARWEEKHEQDGRKNMRLTQEELDRFDRDGYLFIAECFSSDEVRVLTDELPGIFAQRRDEVWREKDGEAVRTAFAAHTYNEAFRRLAAHPRLIEPVQQILDGRVYMHQFKINAKRAFDGDVWQWHQDYGTWARDDLMPEPRAMNIALFLDEVTEFNGPLMFIPRSHKSGVMEAARTRPTPPPPLCPLATP